MRVIPQRHQTVDPPSFLRGLGPEAFLDRCLAEIGTRDPFLGAFVIVDEAGARKQAAASARRWREGTPLSPLDGLPVGIKDIIDTADLPTQMNSPIMAGHRPPVDAACVAALRRAGLVIVGKTVTTEFACGRSGATVNPHDQERTPGGSSSGSAAAVGAGLVPVALGTQTRASTIRPASFCGVYGFKPSFGSLNLGGIHPVSASFDHLGIIAASLELCWIVARLMADGAGGSPGHAPLAGPMALPEAAAPSRIAILRTPGWSELDASTQKAFDNLVTTLAAQGTKVDLSDASSGLRTIEQLLDGSDLLARELISCEMNWPYRGYREHFPDLLSETIRQYLKMGDALDTAGYLDRMERCRNLTRTFDALCGEYDFFLSLSAGPAPRGLEYTGSRAFITPWNLVGAPTLNLPLLQDGGLPVGVQAIGARGSDAALLARARWLDDFSWHHLADRWSSTPRASQTGFEDARTASLAADHH